MASEDLNPLHAHILYLKSSGDIFSRISDHLSRETPARFWSAALTACSADSRISLELSSTALATYMGDLVRSAIEIASLGRESILTAAPSRVLTSIRA